MIKEQAISIARRLRQIADPSQRFLVRVRFDPDRGYFVTCPPQVVYKIFPHRKGSWWWNEGEIRFSLNKKKNLIEIY